MNRITAVLAAAALTAACSRLAWKGGGPPVDHEAEVRVSEEPSRRPPDPVVPPAPADRTAAAAFYSDLGPDELDVSAYPAQQRANYAIYKDACARCHTLARSLNAPVVSRAWWEFYVLGMRVRGRLADDPLSKEEVRAALDFLEHDARARKAGRAREFEAATEELKRRFEAELARRMGELQKAPRPTPR